MRQLKEAVVRRSPAAEVSRTARSTHRWRVRTLILGIALTLVAGVLSALPASASIQDGRVLPASSPNHGWTLERAVQATFGWNAGKRKTPPPKTPFQILYVTGAGHTSHVGNGQFDRNSRSFRVPVGTSFFLPIAFNNDQPPVLGKFPTTHTQALGYWFDKTQLGTRGVTITIDGRATQLSHDYLVGPLRQPGTRYHLVEEAAFLSALPKGHHVVRMSFTWIGTLAQQAYETGFYTFEATYPITVG